MAEQSTVTAKEEIGRAAEQAVRVIANAAEQAAKTVAEATAAAVKVSSAKAANDHDLLIRIETLMGVLTLEMKELKDGTRFQINDHETRIKKLENKIGGFVITIALYSAAVATLIGVIIYHIMNNPT